MTLSESNPRYLAELYLDQYRPKGYELASDIRNAAETADFLYFRPMAGGTDEVVKQVQLELGDNLPLLAKAGEQELEERAIMHERLYQSLPAAAIIEQRQKERMFNSSGELLVNHFYATERFHGMAELINMSPYRHFAQGHNALRANVALDDQELFGTASASNLKHALELKARIIQSQRSEAMALDERIQLSALDVEYGRGHIWQDEYYRSICQGLATHYGLDDKADNTFIWLTNKGIWAQRLSLEATTFHLKDQNPAIVLFGTPYFEVNTFPGKLNDIYGVNLPGKVTRVKDYQELTVAAESAKESKKPLIIYFDPISSYPNAKAADAEAIFQIASANYKSDSDVPCFIIADMTTCAGVFQIFDKAKATIGNSRVNLIATQSMLKYWQWGMDFDPLGAIIAFGPDVGPNLKNPLYDKFSQFYYFHLAEPSLKLLSYLPPVDSEYMKYRAARIDRNTAHGVSVIEEDCRSQNIQGVRVS